MIFTNPEQVSELPFVYINRRSFFIENSMLS